MHRPEPVAVQVEEIVVASALLVMGPADRQARAMAPEQRAHAEADPGDEGRRQAFELLLRVWQRSEGGALRRAAGDRSLLLVEVPIEALQEGVPALKARWIATGNLAELLAGLAGFGGGLWCVTLEPRGPMRFQRLLATSVEDGAADQTEAS